MSLLALSSLVVFNSCENEKADLIIASEITKNEVSIKDGRLFFQNKETLNRVYKEYANATDDKLNSFLEPLYQKSFHSLRPIVTEKNEELIYNLYKNKAVSQNNLKKSTSKIAEENFDYLDAVEEVIGDDTYATLLNSEGEIQVGEDVYKYTDVGLFITKANKLDYLKNYLTTNKISENLAIETSQTVKQTSLPQIFQDDLTFEFFGTSNSWLDGQIQNGIDSNLKATKLNEYFYDGLYSQVKSQLQSAFGGSTIPPKNRTFVAKFPENGKMIIQKSVNLQGFNIGVRERTFDWGAQICLSAGGSSWNIQPDTGCDILVKPKNFRVKIIGAVRHGNEWHGSKFNDGID